jgi:hypothetical protein
MTTGTPLACSTDHQGPSKCFKPLRPLSVRGYTQHTYIAMHGVTTSACAPCPRRPVRRLRGCGLRCVPTDVEMLTRGKRHADGGRDGRRHHGERRKCECGQLHGDGSVCELRRDWARCGLHNWSAIIYRRPVQACDQEAAAGKKHRRTTRQSAHRARRVVRPPPLCALGVFRRAVFSAHLRRLAWFA